MSLLRELYEHKSDRELANILADRGIPIYPWTTRDQAINQLLDIVRGELQTRSYAPTLFGGPTYQPSQYSGPVPYLYRQ